MSRDFLINQNYLIEFQKRQHFVHSATRKSNIKHHIIKGSFNFIKVISEFETVLRMKAEVLECHQTVNHED